MALITQDRRHLVALLVPPHIRVGGRCMRVVAAPLAFPVRLPVTAAALRWRIVQTLFRNEILVAGPCLDQRAIDREMLARQQAALVCHCHDFGKERFDHFMVEQAVAVLRKCRV